MQWRHTAEQASKHATQKFRNTVQHSVVTDIQHVAGNAPYSIRSSS